MTALMKSAANQRLVREKLHQHLRRLLKKVWKDYLKSFRRCRAKFSKDSVHRLRVESRRLLAVLNLLETLVDRFAVAQSRHLIKKSLRGLGKLRDTQVQLLDIGNNLRSFPGVKGFYKALGQRERRLVRQVGARLCRTRLRKIKTNMAALRKEARCVLANPTHELGHRKALARAINQALVRVTVLRSQCRENNLKTFHRLRVALKEFRYTIELLQPLLPGGIKEELKMLHEVHDRLGAIQDACVLVAGLKKFCRKKPRQAPALRKFCRGARRRRALLVDDYLAGACRIDRLLMPMQPRRGQGGVKHREVPCSAIDGHQLKDSCRQ
jgi:CHAD domain-containing protein